jgi:hypothetical protein
VERHPSGRLIPASYVGSRREKNRQGARVARRSWSSEYEREAGGELQGSLATLAVLLPTRPLD